MEKQVSRCCTDVWAMIVLSPWPARLLEFLPNRGLFQAPFPAAHIPLPKKTPPEPAGQGQQQAIHAPRHQIIVLLQPGTPDGAVV